jgi:hypothetical protein
MVIVIVAKDDDPVQLRMDDIYDHSFVSTIQHHVHHISNTAGADFGSLWSSITLLAINPTICRPWQPQIFEALQTMQSGFPKTGMGNVHIGIPMSNCLFDGAGVPNGAKTQLLMHTNTNELLDLYILLGFLTEGTD